MNDIRLALRQVRRQPAFFLAAMLVLALGTGANAAMFSVIRHVLLTPLPYPSPEDLYRVWSVDVRQGSTRGGISLQNFADYRQRADGLVSLAAYHLRTGSLKGPEPRSIGYALVSPRFLQVLGISPQWGRSFDPSENLPGRDDVAIVSHALWQSLWGGRMDALGETVSLDGRKLRVIGILPPDFRAPEGEVDLLKPFGMNPDDAGPRGSFWASAMARLLPRVSREQAQSASDAIAAALREEHPEENADVGIFLQPLHEVGLADTRQALIVLWGAAGLVLVLACVNVGGLVLVRGLSRSREMSIRGALGAGRSTLVRLQLAESGVVALGATALGLFFAWLGLRLLPAFASGRLPRAESISVDPVVLAFSLLVGAGIGIGVGLFPALQAARADMQGCMRATGSAPSAPSRRRVRSSLVSLEIALALVLLIGAGLLLRSFDRLTAVPLGFRAENLVTFRLEPPMLADPSGESMEEFVQEFIAERERASAFYGRLQGRLESIPGVTRVSAINRMPLSGNAWTTGVAIEGRRVEAANQMVPAAARAFADDYFATMSIPLLAGRAMTPSDGRDTLPAAIISEALAAQWPGESPLGKRITFEFPPDEARIWWTIVGVVGDVRDSSLIRSPRAVVYTPMRQSFFGFFGDWGMDVVLKVERDPAAVMAAARRIVAELDPDLPVERVRTMGEVVRGQTADTRFHLWLLGAMAAIALTLAGAGIYGLVSFTAQQRRQEIGIRMTLGAGRSAIASWMLRGFVRYLAVGIVLGTGGAFLASRFLGSLLYGVGTTDSVVFVLAPLTLTAAALAALWLPTRRASRLDPKTVVNEP